VKIVVFNNGALSFVELEMKAAGIVTYGIDLPTSQESPDPQDCSRRRWPRPGNWRMRCARRSITTGRPWSTSAPPGTSSACRPKLTYGEIKGFTLYATRTILSGEGEELIELARTNLHDLDIE
jgi:pyruvate dehydrogenase (quinone)